MDYNTKVIYYAGSAGDSNSIVVVKYDGADFTNANVAVIQIDTVCVL